MSWWGSPSQSHEREPQNGSRQPKSLSSQWDGCRFQRNWSAMCMPRSTGTGVSRPQPGKPGGQARGSCRAGHRRHAPASLLPAHSFTCSVRAALRPMTRPRSSITPLGQHFIPGCTLPYPGSGCIFQYVGDKPPAKPLVTNNKMTNNFPRFTELLVMTYICGEGEI